MGLTEIKIADKTKQFSTYEDGFKIYKAMKNAIDKGDTVNLSFDSILAVPSSFINGCFSKLIDDIGIENIKKNVKISNSTNSINNMIKRKFTLASS
ncbi:STAS-like domain-containing protein [Neisseria sp. Dent CA1/247]|uniref:STAS-like domain-containing protein n=1 Tax=Neisseria sp. Dent CA1/247 TaxID=2912675 RepID=UPI001FD5C3E0|nr:STAS-like domain-containing protein [Neisseria sp. Dent CA1/247]UOO77956.1 STAS-like domain-containing protein [Neisseria sp. Dent CA1/247]